jgi:hypothetical protein
VKWHEDYLANGGKVVELSEFTEVVLPVEIEIDWDKFDPDHKSIIIDYLRMMEILGD